MFMFKFVVFVNYIVFFFGFDFVDFFNFDVRYLLFFIQLKVLSFKVIKYDIKNVLWFEEFFGIYN